MRKSLMLKQKKPYSQEFTETLMEIPKISLAISGIGMLTILLSFLKLQNPFFLVCGIFMGLVLFYISYDHWYKVLHSKKMQSLETRMDSISVELNNGGFE